MGQALSDSATITDPVRLLDLTARWGQDPRAFLTRANQTREGLSFSASVRSGSAPRRARGTKRGGSRQERVATECWGGARPSFHGPREDAADDVLVEEGVDEKCRHRDPRELGQERGVLGAVCACSKAIIPPGRVFMARSMTKSIAIRNSFQVLRHEITIVPTMGRATGRRMLKVNRRGPTPSSLATSSSPRGTDWK